MRNDVDTGHVEPWPPKHTGRRHRDEAAAHQDGYGPSCNYVLLNPDPLAQDQHASEAASMINRGRTVHISGETR